MAKIWLKVDECQTNMYSFVFEDIGVKKWSLFFGFGRLKFFFLYLKVSILARITCFQVPNIELCTWQQRDVWFVIKMNNSFSQSLSYLSQMLFVKVEVQCFILQCSFCVCVCTDVWSPIKVNYVDIKSSRSTENPLGISAAALPGETTHAHSIATHSCTVGH